MMEILYAPTFASDNCVVFAAAFAGAAALFGMAIGALIWFVLRKSKSPLSLPVAVIAGGCLLLVPVGLVVLSATETMVRVATDWTVLEHRTCRQSKLTVELHRIDEITAMNYRKERRRSGNSVRESHHLDIYVPARTQPISISLDATASEVDLEKLRRLAPDVILQYERSR